MKPGPEVEHGKMSRVDALKAKLAAEKSVRMKHIADLEREARVMSAAYHAHKGDMAGYLMHKRPLGITPGLQSSVDNSRHNRSVSMTHNPTFNIHGGSPHTAMAAARLQADRGNADLIRNMTTIET